MAFVDTSFWFARAVTRDSRHATQRSSASSSRAHVSSRRTLCSARPGRSLTRAGHHRAIRWLDGLRAEPVVVEYVDRDLQAQAWEWLRIHDERPYSFVDATSFALMRKLRIREALAFDGDFAAAGFVELRPGV